MGTIDGTDWSEVTIDGESVQEITVDGEVVWTASGVKITATVGTDSVTMVWYEDIDNDGEAEYTDQFQVQDGTNSYSLDGLSLSSGSDIWFEIEDLNRTVTEEFSIDQIILEY